MLNKASLKLLNAISEAEKGPLRKRHAPSQRRSVLSSFALVQLGDVESSDGAVGSYDDGSDDSLWIGAVIFVVKPVSPAVR